MEKIRLFRVRDIGDTIKDAFALLKEQAAPLWKNIFLIVLPAYLLIAVGLVVTMKDLLLLAQEMQGGNPEDARDSLDSLKDMIISPVFWIGIITVMVVSLLVQAFMNSTTFNFIDAYHKDEEAAKNPETLRSISIGDMGWYIGYSLLIGLIFMVIFMVPLGGAVAMESIAFTLLISIGLLVFIFVLLPTLILFFPVAFIEKTGFRETWDRARFLTKGEWGATFGLTIIVGLLGGIASSVVSNILGLVGTVFGEFGKLLFTQVGQLGMSSLIGVISGTCYALHYGSLRAKKEGASDGFLGEQLIEEIGKQEEDDNTTQTW
ncbi:MAG: hypothetical protein K1X92_04840 [Bacteroidia bacterium]|nr:hypothetical protein [Bacteroidia bacterium]